MADPDRNTDGAPPRQIHIEGEEKSGFNWLPWLLLALGLLALLWGLSRCSDRDTAVVTNTTTTEVVPADNATAGNTTVAATNAGVSGLGTYLGGTEAVPRTFAFERLNFDTAKSDIRPQDRDELNQVAATLKQYGTTRIRVVGYADARGSDPANARLGAARADSVKQALVAQGIAADRIETATGGENDPVDTNATAGGQAENRRTEIVVIQR